MEVFPRISDGPIHKLAIRRAQQWLSHLKEFALNLPAVLDEGNPTDRRHIFSADEHGGVGGQWGAFSLQKLKTIHDRSPIAMRIDLHQ